MGAPKGIKGTRRKLRDTERMAAAAVKGAMMEASRAIDQLSQENAALKRVIVGERAEALYYIAKYRECSPHAVPFRELTEEQQTPYFVEAVKKLSEVSKPEAPPSMLHIV